MTADTFDGKNLVALLERMEFSGNPIVYVVIKENLEVFYKEVDFGDFLNLNNVNPEDSVTDLNKEGLN